MHQPTITLATAKKRRPPSLIKTSVQTTHSVSIRGVDISVSFRRSLERTHNIPFLLSAQAWPDSGTFSDTLDMIDVCVTFGQIKAHWPTLSQLLNASVGCSYPETTHSQPRTPRWYLLPDCPADEIEYKEGESYLIYPTHQLLLDSATQRVKSVLFRLTNNAAYRRKSTDVQLVLQLDLAPLFFEPHFGKRYHGLDPIPVNVDPNIVDYMFKPEDVPQRTPFWFSYRGVGGSRCIVLLGFFKDDDEFTLFDRTNMRAGAINEDLALAIYLKSFEAIEYYERGWCQMPQASKLPSTWGASPDGLIIDPNMQLDLVPEAERNLLPDNIDIKRGALEIKCSRGQCIVPPRGYHLAQMYMEMAALNTAWSDLINLHRATSYCKETGTYKSTYTVYWTRFFRHMGCEKLLIDCMHEALAEQHNLEAVVKRQHFVKLRKYLNEFASTRLESHQLEITPEIQLIIDDFYNQRMRVFEPSTHIPQDPDKAKEEEEGEEERVESCDVWEVLLDSIKDMKATHQSGKTHLLSAKLIQHANQINKLLLEFTTNNL